MKDKGHTEFIGGNASYSNNRHLLLVDVNYPEQS